MWWRDMRTNWSWKRSNDFSDILRNNSKILYGSHWPQWFLELVYSKKTAMLLMSHEWEVKASIPSIIHKNIYVTVWGHSPLSRPVAWRQSSSPTGLGYRRYASTHPLNALQMAALRAAIWTHLATEHWHLCAPPKFSIKAVHAATRGSLLVSHWLSHI